MKDDKWINDYVLSGYNQTSTIHQPRIQRNNKANN